jgi:DNA-binding MarR family transcriptional regulator
MIALRGIAGVNHLYRIRVASVVLGKEDKTLKHSELLQALEEQSRELSTRTVIFHHFIGERLGLNPTDHKCLDLIIRAETPMTATQLAEETGLSTGTITGVMDRLEKAGYVRRKRDTDDRRLIFIKPLLDKAMIKLGPIFEPIRKASINLYTKYTDEELTTILDYITNCNRMTQDLTAEMQSKGT